MLQKVLIQEMSNLQPADECECEHLLITIEDLGKLVLKEVDVGLQVIFRPHPNREEVMTTPLGFLMSGVLCEEGLGNL